jgi:hypothetical protein
MRMRFRFSFELLLVLLVLVSHAYAAFAPANSLMNWFTTDDAFYYYKTAQNIAEGHGATFDGIAPTNGFHPLWMLVCVPIFALARYNLILPLRIVVMVLALLNAGTAILLYRTVRRIFSQPAAVVTALAWAFYPGIHKVTTQLGVEAGLNAFCLALLLYALVLYEANPADKPVNRPLIWVAGAALLALLARLDNIFLLAVLGIWVAFRSRLLRALLLGDLLLLCISVYAAFLLRLDFAHYYFYEPFLLYMLVPALVIKPLVFFAFGLYRRETLVPGWKLALRTALAALLGSALVTGLVLGMISVNIIGYFPRIALPIDAVLTLLFALGLRLVCAWFETRTKDTPHGDTAWKPNWKTWFTRGGLYYGALAVTLLAYMTWSSLTVGTASPVSGQIKRWWGTIYTVYGYPAKTYPGLLGLTTDRNLGPWSLASDAPVNIAYQVARLTGANEDAAWETPTYRNVAWGLGLLLIGGCFMLMALRWKLTAAAGRQLVLVPWLAGCLVQAESYKLTGYVETLHWYWIAQDLLVVVLAGLGLEALYQLIRCWKPATAPQRGDALTHGMSLVINIVLLGSFLSMLVPLTPWDVNPKHAEGYLDGARALEAATQPGDVIGSTGGGTLGYFVQGRTIVNLDGLINSYTYYQMLKAGTAGQYYDRIGLRYVYGAKYILVNSEPYKYVFDGRLEDLGEVVGSELYKYR